MHFTPPGSHCSTVVGKGIGTAAPGYDVTEKLICGLLDDARHADVPMANQ